MCIEPAYFAVFPDFTMSLCKVASSVTFSVGIAAISSIAVVAGPVNALTLTTASGIDYDIVLEETTFDALSGRSNFSDLVPWFNEGVDGEGIAFDETIAFELATDAFNKFIDPNEADLGTPNGSAEFVGPFFLYARNSDNLGGSAAFTTYDGNTQLNDNSSFVDGQFDPNATAFYAIVNLDVEPIPTPALIPGLIGMGLAVIRKRKSDTA
ncbi:MAG: PTPA-CTERM sorting domain-containing protein [Leptolyngbyaceae cyanobacterium MAG.088]|nr:PTPA-CTERM sorting domain-containing protein [Leptolyngbyaceae cyanobacterium MAG.088]